MTLDIICRMGRCWLWGAGPPQSAQCSGGLSPGPFCGVCMFSPCSQGVSSSKNPNRKNMQNNRTHVHPWPKMDSSLHLVPRRYKLPTAPGRSLRKDGPGWENAESKFTATSGVCVCVSCVASIFARVSCVPIKSDNYYYLATQYQ